MTQTEFKQWWADFTDRFQSKANWATQNGGGMLRTWAEVLASTELVDAIAANKSFQLGEAEWPNDWERIPVAVKDVAHRMLYRRTVARPIELPDDGQLKKRCGQCDGKGIHLEQDDAGRWYGYACHCEAGHREARERTSKATGKKWKLLRIPTPVQRISEFDDWNNEPF